MTKTLVRVPAYTTGVMSLIWAGMLLGVSFLATPVKFLAPSLDLPVALDVGRQTFSAFNKLELALAASIVAAVLASGPRRLTFALSGILAVIVIAQATWLLPQLDARVEVILSGGTPATSNLHSFYISAELFKLVALAALAYVSSRSASEKKSSAIAFARAKRM